MDEKIRELAERMLALDPNLTEREAFARARLEVDNSVNIDNVTAMPNQFRKEVEEEARRLMLIDSNLSESDAIAKARGDLLGRNPFGEEVLGIDNNASVFSMDFLSGLQDTNDIVGDNIVNQEVIYTDENQRDGFISEKEGNPRRGSAYEGDVPENPQYQPSFLQMPFLYSGGTSPTYRAYQLGAFSGAEDMGGVQRGLGILGSAGALTLGLGREFMSGFANTRQTGRVIDDARSIQNRREYSDNPIHRDRNALGGKEFKLGGRVVSKPDKKR